MSDSSLLSNEYLRHLITREMTESVNKFSNKKKGYFYNSSNYKFIEALKSIVYLNLYNCLFDKIYDLDSECKKSFDLINKHYKLVDYYFEEIKGTIGVVICKKKKRFPFKGFFLKEDKINEFETFLITNNLLTVPFNEIQKYFVLVKYKAYTRDILNNSKCDVTFSLGTYDPGNKFKKERNSRELTKDELNDKLFSSRELSSIKYQEKERIESELYKKGLRDEDIIKTLSLDEKSDFYKKKIYDILDIKHYNYQVKHYFNSLIDVTTLMINDTINKILTKENKEKHLDDLFKEYNRQILSYENEKKKIKFKEISEDKIDKKDIKNYKYLDILINYTKEVLKNITNIYRKLNSKDSSSPRRSITRRSTTRRSSPRKSRSRSILKTTSKYRN
jgi:hypothetical protein